MDKTILKFYTRENVIQESSLNFDDDRNKTNVHERISSCMKEYIHRSCQGTCHKNVKNCPNQTRIIVGTSLVISTTATLKHSHYGRKRFRLLIPSLLSPFYFIFALFTYGHRFELPTSGLNVTKSKVAVIKGVFFITPSHDTLN